MGAVQRCSIDLMAFQRDVRIQLPALFHLEPSICLLISRLSRRGNKLGAAALCHCAEVNFQSADHQGSQRCFSGKGKMAARGGTLVEVSATCFLCGCCTHTHTITHLLLDKCEKRTRKKENKNPSQFNVVSYNPFPGCTMKYARASHIMNFCANL